MKNLKKRPFSDRLGRRNETPSLRPRAYAVRRPEWRPNPLPQEVVVPMGRSVIAELSADTDRDDSKRVLRLEPVGPGAIGASGPV